MNHALLPDWKRRKRTNWNKIGAFVLVVFFAVLAVLCIRYALAIDTQQQIYQKNLTDDQLRDLYIEYEGKAI